VKPFVPKMTQSELLTLMASGMAHISGGMMAVYISYGADPVAILCTCVMACPCSLYLAKLVMPETETPVTSGDTEIVVPRMHENPIDAAASGVKDGLMLAMNVAAMLIGFLAFIALFDALIGGVKPMLLACRISAESVAWIPDNLTLSQILGGIFQPVAMLLGVPMSETSQVGSLLGIKLAANEHVAYITLTKDPEYAMLSERAKILAVYALTGFANFSSIGIQLGGIGALAPERRGDLARLGLTALFVGFLATLLNAAIAGLLLP
jgi:CNT family concentrative nucleoside transporter